MMTTTTNATPELPHEVVLDILCLLPPESLTRFIFVCKRWSDSILNDSQFALRQLRHYSQKNPSLLLKFEAMNIKHNKNDNYLSPDVECQFFSLGNTDDYQVRRLGTITPSYAKRLVGFCNGLVCLYRQHDRIFEVCNTTRREILGIFPSQPINNCPIICYGFGFDSLTNEYKVVVVFEKFRCMVFTLGSSKSSSWKEIQVRDKCEGYLPDRLLIFEGQLGSNRLPAIFCNGALFWKKRCDAPCELLMFSLHDEMFQIIKLPDEYVYPYHLFEHKGSLCVARMGDGERLENHIGLMRKVQVDTLTKEKYNNDKQKLLWTTETFVVEKSIVPNQNPTTGFKSALFLTFDDQIFINCWKYRWSYCPVLYNVRSKEHRSVKLPDGIGRSSRCYSAYNHTWNFLSLKTFIQERVHKILHSYPSLEDIKQMKKQETKSDIAFMFSGSQTEFYL